MKLFTVLLPILASCSVGTYGESGDNSGDDMPGVEDRNVCVDRVATPAQAYVHTGADGQAATPRDGEGCIQALCHATGNTGAGAPAFAFAGTVYKDLEGTIPNPGVTVRMFPGTGNTMKSVATTLTDTAGNFYIQDTGTLASFPYATDATACGSDAIAKGIRTMVGAIATKAEANCNAGGTCHQAKPTKTATPIYLMD